MFLFFNWFTDVTGINDILDDILKLLSEYINKFMNNLINSMMQGMFQSIDGMMKEADKIFDNKYILNIQEPLFAVAYALLGLFFVIEFCKTSVYFENMTIERFLKPMVMLVVGKVIIGKSGFILKTISTINMKITNTLMGGGIDNAETIERYQKIAHDTINANLSEKGAAVGVAFFSTIINSVSFLVILVAVFIIIFIFCARYLEIAILFIISPIFFATLIADVTNDVFKSFIKQFIAVTFQTIIIVVALRLVLFITNGEGTIKFIEKDVSGVSYLNMVMGVITLVLLCFITLKAKSFFSKLLGR
ncbi:MAG: conjugal transfer protein TrbL family protein [Clostridiales bacterium]